MRIRLDLYQWRSFPQDFLLLSKPYSRSSRKKFSSMKPVTCHTILPRERKSLGLFHGRMILEEIARCKKMPHRCTQLMTPHVTKQGATSLFCVEGKNSVRLLNLLPTSSLVLNYSCFIALWLFPPLMGYGAGNYEWWEYFIMYVSFYVMVALKLDDWASTSGSTLSFAHLIIGNEGVLSQCLLSSIPEFKQSLGCRICRLHNQRYCSGDDFFPIRIRWNWSISNERSTMGTLWLARNYSLQGWKDGNYVLWTHDRKIIPYTWNIC